MQSSKAELWGPFSGKTMSLMQEKTTTVAVDTTMVMNHTTINTKREFHSEETSSYWLPKDEEGQRLTAVSKHEA
ncbi:hypothetical protein G6F57_007847 [Rhizopus arrhizus]|uniref:Uncharacterized protein n=1 Tax=Rhizopus delemar TaxID=936053 RepID=A0A9P6XM43_9FUNG|nr:hypothetical protein G6F23_013044 [Rhizopus arrhizus]KAG1525202.1 hypothetical protein G6F50_018471 [Rhizopus delemar]KAG0945649.1 hypothetical protein G6F30_004176 [Rhizopus arrhizus]KAG0986281.1 hypothetical protein G6F29_003372 [Rhizopus arrhizus]KAG0993699.1 hypothetical protein G6F28_006443 [Rhizopus arrhizus]